MAEWRVVDGFGFEIRRLVDLHRLRVGQATIKKRWSMMMMGDIKIYAN